MKKIVVIVIAVVAVAALAFGVVNFVRANQAQTAVAGQGWIQGVPGMMQYGYGERSGRMMDNQGAGRGRSMMGTGQSRGYASGADTLHTYMQDALAEKLGMTSDELSTSLNDGKSLLDLAADKGMTVADFQTMQEEARVAAIDKALADGVISQNQADWMKTNQVGFHMGFGGW
jgi:hypothetical protein